MRQLTRSSTYTTEGVVLSRRELGDTDRLVTLFTREFGLRRVVARGSRRPSSPLAPHLELFSRVRAFVVVGTNLDILSQVEALETFSRVRDDLASFSAAGWAIELLAGLSQEGDASPKAYDAIVAFLRTLESADRPPEFQLAALALALLDIHGFRPELDQCAHCHDEIQADHHAFAPSAGGVVCDRCATDYPTEPLTLEALKSLRYLAREGLPGAARLAGDAALRAEIRQHLFAYATVTLERDIKSARMLDAAAAHVAARAP